MLEQTVLQFSGVYKVYQLIPINKTHIAKADYSMAATHQSKESSGDIDVYIECGGFNFAYSVPFLFMSTLIMVSWIILRLRLKQLHQIVPHDANNDYMSRLYFVIFVLVNSYQINQITNCFGNVRMFSISIVRDIH